MKLCPSERHSSPTMPGEALRDSSPAHTAAAALYGWTILQIGDSVGRHIDNRAYLCSGKPAMTLAREHSSKDKVDLLYIPWPISPEDLAKRLSNEMHRDLEWDIPVGTLSERV